MVSADTQVDKDGNVTGTIYFNKDMPGFGGDEKDGNFFPIMLDSKYADKEITVKRDGVYRNKAQDLEWVLRVPSKESKFTFETDEDSVFLTLNFSGATLNIPVGEDAVAVASQERDFGRFGNTKELIDTDVAIAWAGTKGTMTGKVKKYTYSDTTVWGAEKSEGHFVPFVLDRYKGQSITCTASNSKTSNDHEWILRIDEVKKGTHQIKFEHEGIELADIDISGLTLNET